MTQRGTLLGGRYELDEVIGRGGMAEVWRARDTRLQRDVAVKRLRVDLASDPTFQARFRREAQASAGLNHPNIVAVYDTGEEKDAASDVMVPYIVMELIEGVTLREVLRGGRKIVPEKALEFTAGVLDALAYSHRSGIIHRDIKPANVMFTPPGTIKVMDFGIARAVADTSATMTQTAAVIGTAQYLSPEQARGEKVDNRSDLYSVGCLLYELLVSEPPFKGDSPVSVAYQHVREQPVPPSQRDPEITADMDAIVLKALAKDPRDRYQDAGEFREDIMRVLNNVKPAAAVASPPGSEEPTRVIASDPITATARRAAIPAGAGAAGVAGAAAVSPHSVDGLPAYDDEPEEKKSRRGLIALAILAALVILGLIIALALLLGPGDGKPEPVASTTPSVTQSPSEEATASDSATPELVAVPRVEGLARQDAENRLKDAGFVTTVEDVPGTQENDGKVESTDPAGGTEVERGSSVLVKVYKYEAPTELTIPDNLVGMTEQEAIDELVALGFEPGNIRSTKADPANEPIDAKAGSVIAVSPTGKAVADAAITLTIATGESKVPELTGMTQNRAIETAKAAGFEVEVNVQKTADQPEGVVFEQNPPKDSTLKRDTPITITVAEAPAVEEPPAEEPPAQSDEPSEEPAPEPTQKPAQEPTEEATP